MSLEEKVSGQASQPNTEAAQNIQTEAKPDNQSAFDRRSAQASSISTFPEHKKSNFNYDALADLIASQPKVSIFRRFAKLNAKNLLYLQAEITLLEHELELLEEKDQESDDPNKRQFQWEVRRLAASEGEQWQKVLQIRAKLKEYNDALIQFQQLNALPPPYQHNIERLQEYLTRPDYGAMWLELPEDVWFEELQSEHNDDLVDLSSRSGQGDRFTRWFSYRFMPWLHRTILHPPRASAFATSSAIDPEAPPSTTTTRKAADAPLYDYSDSFLANVAETCSIVVSSLFPTVTIFALNYIPQNPPVARLAFITVFSAIFTVAISVFTEAKRIEIFAAVVALASIQVVFIGANNCGSGYNQ